MINSPIKILTYPGQSYSIYLDDSLNYEVEEIPETDWLELITFRDEEIQTMSNDDILQRIAALRSIKGAPHFCFNWEQKDTPGFKLFFEHVMKYYLNGNAGGKIFELEKYAASIKLK
jgi:hypothetical protein